MRSDTIPGWRFCCRVFLGLLPLGLPGATGGPYEAVPQSLASGGRAGSGASVVDHELGAFVGAMSAAGVVNRSGFVGQLVDVASVSFLLVVSAAEDTVDESDVRQLNAEAVMTDESVSDVTGVADWMVLTGPASINASGLVSGQPVYADTSAVIEARWMGQADSLTLTVVNSDGDNFGIYAEDGLEDGWQVGYFGVGNSRAAPGEDPDGDGQDNRFEFAGGFDPLDGDSRLRIDLSGSSPDALRVRLEPVVGEPGFIVESSGNLVDWSPVSGASIESAGNVRIITVSGVIGDPRFVRIRVP